MKPFEAPWEIHSEPNGFFIYSRTASERNETAIALVYNSQHAPMIVASPQVLESLKEMVAHLIQCARFGGLNSEETGMLNRAERAISEAESIII